MKHHIFPVMLAWKYYLLKRVPQCYIKKLMWKKWWKFKNPNKSLSSAFTWWVFALALNVACLSDEVFLVCSGSGLLRGRHRWEDSAVQTSARLRAAAAAPRRPRRAAARRPHRGHHPRSVEQRAGGDYICVSTQRGWKVSSLDFFSYLPYF